MLSQFKLLIIRTGTNQIIKNQLELGISSARTTRDRGPVNNIYKFGIPDHGIFRVFSEVYKFDFSNHGTSGRERKEILSYKSNFQITALFTYQRDKCLLV